MKNKRNAASLLSAAVILLMPFATRAQFEYAEAGYNTFAILGYTGPGGNVTIPSSYKGFPVSIIGPSAFNQQESITSVVIPDSVTTIQGSAFGICTNLTNVTMGSGVTSIGESAFASCYGLTNVVIGPNVTSIGDYTYYACTNLRSLTIPSSNAV